MARLPDFFRVEVASQFYALKDYIHFVESHIQDTHHSTRAELLSSHESPPPGADENEIQEWLSLSQEQIDECDRRFAVHFRRTLRFSVVVSLFTLVESNMLRVGDEMKRREQLALGVTDLQAKDLVHRFKKFWTKVADRPWWEDERWQSLKDLQEIRNCVAHHNGVVRDNDGRIKQILGQNRGIRLVDVTDRLMDPDEAATLVIEERFCGEMIAEMKALFDEIFERATCFGPDHVVRDSDESL